MAATKPEVHHAAPRCLMRLHQEANGGGLDGEGIQAWLEWEWEATRWRVPADISEADLRKLVAASEELLKRERHRLLHATDWQRWGSRGGRETVRRYGSAWMSLLALRRWGKVSPEDLDAARPLR